MDPVTRSPLIDLLRRGEVPREVKLQAAQGALAPRAQEQLGLLVLLAGDPDAEIAAAARRTLEAAPRSAIAACLARKDVSDEVRAYFAAGGFAADPSPHQGPPMPGDAPLVDLGGDPDLAEIELELEGVLAGAAGDAPADGEGDEAGKRRPLSTLPVIERMKVAMRGSREQRAVLIRDPNKLVSTAVLSSPKLTETEVESFSRMGNVSEEVLRIIGTNRTWTKHYGVMAALARNPKTPASVSMPMVGRLNERDLKLLSVDRNVPEGLRIAARKLVVSNESRRK